MRSPSPSGATTGGGILAAAVLLTLAIVSHHFTAMGAVEIIPDPTRVIDQFSISPPVLAIAVASAALAILGMSFAGAFADRRLRERDLQLVTAVNNMPQGLVMFDAGERMVVCNDRYLEMYGLSRELVKPGLDLARGLQQSGCGRQPCPRPGRASIRIARGGGGRQDDEHGGRRSRRPCDRGDMSADARRRLGCHPRRHHRTATRRAAHCLFGAPRLRSPSLPNRVSFNERLDAHSGLRGHDRSELRSPVHRSRSLQGGQRCVRTCRRRRIAARAVTPPAGGSRGRIHRTSRRRRVRRDRRGRPAAGERRPLSASGCSRPRATTSRSTDIICVSA